MTEKIAMGAPKAKLWRWLFVMALLLIGGGCHICVVEKQSARV